VRSPGMPAETPRWRRDRRGIARARVAAVCLLLAGLGGCGEKQPSSQNEPPPSVIRGIRTIAEDGGRLDWSTRLNRVAFDRMGPDRYFDVWTMNPDGTGQACLSCDADGLPTRHVGNPAWHPSGDYLVVQAQKQSLTGEIVDFLANPGSGLNNDLYAIDGAGRNSWQLTSVPVGSGGVLHPHFSSDGRQLIWAERVSNVGTFGEWVIRLADFEIQSGTPRVRNVRTLTPGAQHRFYETHGFDSSGGSILFSGNPDAGLSELGIDIYRYNIASGALTNLTASAGEWDEHAHFSPAGDRIVWISSRALGPVSDPLLLRTEFWLMNADGTGKTQLTHFNEPGRPESIPGQAVAGDSDWSPDGRSILGYVVTDPRAIRGRIVSIELNIPDLSESQPPQPSSSMFARAATREPSSVTPEQPAPALQSVSAIAGDTDLDAWEDLLVQLEDRGELVGRDFHADAASGLRSTRYQQIVRGVPVDGGDIVAQFAGDRLVAVFGTWYRQCDPKEPAITLQQAIASAGAGLLLVGETPLTRVAMPLEDGSCRPAFVGRGVTADGPVRIIVDGLSGAVRKEPVPALRPSTTAWGATPLDSPPVSRFMAGRFFADDTSRPPGIIALDLGGGIQRTASALRKFEWADVASDADDEWTDPAIAAFRTSAAAAYDVLLTRFGRRGIRSGVPLVGLVHPSFANPTGTVRAAVAPFHAGGGLIVVPDAGPQSMGKGTDAGSVMRAVADAVVDHTSALAWSGEAGDIRQAFVTVLAGVSDARRGGRSAGPREPLPTVPDRALAIARSHVRASGAEVPPDAIDRVFVAAVTELLPTRATFAMARKAMLQTARNVFPRSPVEDAIQRGWVAAGISEKTH
jgi:hypothetical protein